MRRAERLFRLVNEMRARGLCRAEDLAQALEVSVRTIYRDIAHLQGSGLPIDGEAGVGYLLRPGFDLPSVTFTHDQIDALAVGLAFVERTGDPILVTAAREARAKLQAGLPSPEERTLTDAPYFSLNDQTGATPDISAMRDAIRTRRVVRIVYKDAGDSHSARRVHPLVIWSLTDGWMFSAWCTLRQDFRTFRFDRIQSLEVTEEIFSDDPETGLQTFLDRESCAAH